MCFICNLKTSVIWYLNICRIFLPFNLILVAVQVQQQVTGATESAINNAIGSWLRHAPERSKGSRASSENLFDPDQHLDTESNPENLSEDGDDQNSDYGEDEKQGDEGSSKDGMENDSSYLSEHSN